MRCAPSLFIVCLTGDCIQAITVIRRRWFLMAKELLRHDAEEKCEVESAGTKPGIMRPEAIAVMKEFGMEILKHSSKDVDEFQGQKFDYIITEDGCPINAHNNYGESALGSSPRAIRGKPLKFQKIDSAKMCN